MKVYLVMYMYDTHMTCGGVLCVYLDDTVDIREYLFFFCLFSEAGSPNPAWSWQTCAVTPSLLQISHPSLPSLE